MAEQQHTFLLTELTLKQRFAYQQSYLLAREALGDAIVKLMDRNEADDADRSERIKNRAKILNLEADKALLDARRAAFDANQAVITPPTPDQLDRLRDLVAAVEGLNADQKILDEVLDLTAQSLGLFREIQAA